MTINNCHYWIELNWIEFDTTMGNGRRSGPFCRLCVAHIPKTRHLLQLLRQEWIVSKEKRSCTKQSPSVDRGTFPWWVGGGKFCLRLLLHPILLNYTPRTAEKYETKWRLPCFTQTLTKTVRTWMSHSTDCSGTCLIALISASFCEAVPSTMTSRNGPTAVMRNKSKSTVIKKGHSEITDTSLAFWTLEEIQNSAQSKVKREDWTGGKKRESRLAVSKHGDRDSSGLGYGR